MSLSGSIKMVRELAETHFYFFRPWQVTGVVQDFCFAKEAEEKHVNELEERERLNQQQRPPAATGFFGLLGDLRRVSVAQALGEWCLTGGEICREKYEMMR